MKAITIMTALEIAPGDQILGVDDPPALGVAIPVFQLMPTLRSVTEIFNSGHGRLQITFGEDEKVWFDEDQQVLVIR